MPTRSVLRTVSARDYHTQQAHYLYKNVTFATPNIQTTAGKIVHVGNLPANCLRQETIVRINTSFDGSLIIGTSADTDQYVTAADMDATVADTYVVDRGYGVRSTLDVPVYVQLTTGSTVGDADIWLSYLPAK
jgi:hypothetical protein